MNFIENNTTGRPALALIATQPRTLKNFGKEFVAPTGYIRAVRLIAQSDAGALRSARRELLSIIGGRLTKNWRIAEGSA